MTLRTIALLLAFTPSALAAPVPKELKKPSDTERIQGAWVYDSYDDGGERIARSRRWVFTGGCMQDQTADGKGGMYYSVALRPNKSAAEMDMTFSEVFLGGLYIYRFEGEELYVAVCPGAARPTDFSSSPGKSVYVLKRIPEAKK